MVRELFEADFLGVRPPRAKESNVRPSYTSGVCTTCPLARISSANDTTPGVSPWAWWNSTTSAILVLPLS